MNSNNDSWITMALAIATLITSVIALFGQPLFARWLARKDRMDAEANPDANKETADPTRFARFSRIVYSVRFSVISHSLNIVIAVASLFHYLWLGDVLVTPRLAFAISFAVSMGYFSVLMLLVILPMHRRQAETDMRVQTMQRLFILWLRASDENRQSVMDEIRAELREADKLPALPKSQRRRSKKRELID